MTLKLLLAILFFGTTPICALAQTGSAKANSRVIIEAFIGTCVQTMPRLPVVEAMARSFGWKELSGDMLAVVGAADQSKDAKGWIVRKLDGSTHMVGINSGRFREKNVGVCVIASADATTENIERDLFNVLKIDKKLYEDNSGGQRMRIYSMTVNGDEMFLTYTDAPKLSPNFVSLGVMAYR